jgi:hypothetical protein
VFEPELHVQDHLRAQAQLDFIHIVCECFFLAADLDAIDNSPLFGIKVFDRDGGARADVTLRLVSTQSWQYGRMRLTEGVIRVNIHCHPRGHCQPESSCASWK